MTHSIQHSRPAGRAGTALLCALLVSVTHAQSPDRDGDTSSDIWQAFYGAPSLVAELDSDRDGQSNRDEQTAGTNPLRCDSRLALASVQLTQTDQEGMVTLSWPTVAGKRYQVQQLADPASGAWDSLGDPVDADTTAPFYLNVHTTDYPSALYRVQVSDVDHDGDGLSAAEEIIIGTSDETPVTSGDPGFDDVAAAHQWLELNEPGRDPGGGPVQNLREVEVLRLPGATVGENLFVTAAGTGAWHQLSSWSLSSPSATPRLRVTTPPIDGRLPRLLRVTSEFSQGAEARRFISAAIQADGDLILESRQLNLDGTFSHDYAWEFGRLYDIDFYDYDLAIRPIDSPLGPRYLLTVAATIKTQDQPTSATRLGIYNFLVTAYTGGIVGTQLHDPLQFFSLPFAAEEARLAVRHLGDIHYVVTFTDRNGRLHHRFANIDDRGQIEHRGGDDGGLDLRGDNTVVVSQEANALAEINAKGFLTASRETIQAPDGSSETELKLNVWERRGPEDSDQIPYLLTDPSQDLGTSGPGVFPATPVLHDSWLFTGRDNDNFGAALAVGDFNRDGFKDAVISAPRRDAGADDVGMVYVIYGSLDGLSDQPYHQAWGQHINGVGGVSEEGDRYGEALAVADFNGDTYDDLAIGIPGEDVNSNNTEDGGAVNILYGSPFGLRASGNVTIRQDSLGHPAGPRDYFGREVAAGDFNNDGHDDLAVSAPLREVNGRLAGAVYVVWGSTNGLRTNEALYLHQNVTGMSDTAHAGDNFGAALATGDFNGDRNDDLAIGVPYEDIASQVNAGAVHVLYGNGSAGFSGQNFITQNGFEGGGDIRGGAEEDDRFGFSLAAGDFDNDGADDLAIGAPGEDNNAIVNGGAAHVLYGTFIGLTPVNNIWISQESILPGGGDLVGDNEAHDGFGETLTTGDFDGDGYEDLIVGGPDEDFPNAIGDDHVNAGMFLELRGGADGITSAGARFYSQDVSYVAGTARRSDQFSAALAAGDFNADGKSDLLVGIPYKDRNVEKEEGLAAGAVHIAPGSSSGLDMRNSTEWFLRKRETVRGMVSDLAWEEEGGPGAGRLLRIGHTEPPVHVASVTKVMTLLLAVEAIEAGRVSLDDFVGVSPLAGNTGGSALEQWGPTGIVKDDDGKSVKFIQPNDIMPMRLLLHGMMMRSGNRCSVAIGEHVASQVRSDPLEFVNMMNDRAAELQMTETVYGHPAGGCVTTNQDMITLLREGWKHPLFREISGVEHYGTENPTFELCGTYGNGDPKCNGDFPKHMTIGSYPGRLGWKGGNGLLWFDAGAAHDVPAQPPGVPRCTAAAVAVVERMGRPILMSLQQTGSREADSQALLDYGFRKLFTPDRYGSRAYSMVAPDAIIGTSPEIEFTDFALDLISDRYGVTAVIDGGRDLRLQVWRIDLTGQSIAALGRASHAYQLEGGNTWAPPKHVSIARLPSVRSMGDYLTVHLEDEHLRFNLWRIGEHP